MQKNFETLLSLDHTIATEIFDRVTYPFEVIPLIKEAIFKLGSALPNDRFKETKEGVWIALSAQVAESAVITPPCIIDENAEIRHCAFLRGGVIVGKNAVVGNSTELKNSILFDKVQVPHYNYVGDSILGYKAHMGASSITSNVKMDKSTVLTDYGNGKISSGLKKLGAVIGDQTEIGCGAVLNPGTVIGSGARVYPLSSVRGYLRNGCVYKSKTDITDIEGR
jgi:NDP-sugar pyrophosphorylase family protein